MSPCLRAIVSLAASLVAAAHLTACGASGDDASALKWGCDGEFCDDHDIRQIERAMRNHWNAGTGHGEVRVGNIAVGGQALVFVWELGFQNGYDGTFAQSPHVPELRCKYQKHYCDFTHQNDHCWDEWKNWDAINAGRHLFWGEFYDFQLQSVSLGNGAGSARFVGHAVDFTSERHIRSALNTSFTVQFREGGGKVGTSDFKDIGGIESIDFGGNWGPMASGSLVLPPSLLAEAVPGILNTGLVSGSTAISCGNNASRDGIALDRSWSLDPGERFSFQNVLVGRLNEMLAHAVHDVTGG